MLQIEDIRKKYVTGELVQTALDGVSLTLRDNEFVAILGPSGSGKTTLLNVIGGLDRYDSGDLVINGISTKKYSDRDWDSYRNHTIGFVFQSYNLIPHQTVLANVELALTISGISRSERKKRARKALEDVGLGNQLHKKPNQMSGGQMQRVAIARALVNDPDILLADEPTGALDSETSVQVMDLLKEVSRDRLVVMVTHNPELAEQYANRIVRVRDGRIVNDSNPYAEEIVAEVPPKHKNMGRASMSFLTALSLSFNNLRTKKARTLLTAFAGSIGIIGIALIMSLSTGFQKYIDKIQEDTLSNYPLTIQSETADMAAAFMAIGSSAMQAADNEPGTVSEQQMISQMFAQIGMNDLAAFKTYLEANMDEIGDTINTIKYSYGIKPKIFAADTSERILQVNPASVFGDAMGNPAMSAYMDTDVFYEMIDNVELLDSQYDVLRGRWPQEHHELVIVLSSPNQMSDYMSYALGLRDPDTLGEMIEKVMNGQEPEKVDDPMNWTYDQLMALQFKLVDASKLYRYNGEYNVWENMSSDQNYMRDVIENGETLSVVGIVCPKEGVSTTTLSTGVAYTADLTRHVIAAASESQIVEKQLADTQTDVFTGKGFGAEEESELSFEDMISIDEEALSSSFGMNISEGEIAYMLESYMAEVAGSLAEDIAPAQAAFCDTLAALASDMLRGYIAQNADDSGMAVLRLTDAQTIVDDFLAQEGAVSKINAMAEQYSLPAETFSAVYDPLLIGLITEYIATQIADTLPETASEEFTAQPANENAEPDEMTTPEETTVPEETTEPTAAVDPTLPSLPEIDATLPSIPEIDVPLPSIPEGDQQITIDPSVFFATITEQDVDAAVSRYMENPVVTGAAGTMAGRMTEVQAQEKLLAELANFGNVLMGYVGSSFYVDEEKLASAFEFEFSEEELRRLMEAMSTADQETSASANLRSLGYADLEQPTAISIYLVDFAAKERFLDFLDGYNADMEAAGQEEQVISYTDVTGIMMSSVRTIIDSVSYVLIAFVAVSLVVSSIMIGIITYISVMERTKEIGVLRAIGASKRNISQVFNAETFIIGLCSGMLGVGIAMLLNIPINEIIHSLTEIEDINAQLPAAGAGVLIVLSMVLTLIGGLIPSKQAAKKDPVIALRSE